MDAFCVVSRSMSKHANTMKIETSHEIFYGIFPSLLTLYPSKRDSLRVAYLLKVYCIFCTYKGFLAIFVFAKIPLFFKMAIFHYIREW